MLRFDMSKTKTKNNLNPIFICFQPDVVNFDMVAFEPINRPIFIFQNKHKQNRKKEKKRNTYLSIIN